MLRRLLADRIVDVLARAAFVAVFATIWGGVLAVSAHHSIVKIGRDALLTTA